jgi:hypothetical protein
MNQPESIDTELLRNACNAAFHELGLDWYWDTGQPLPGAGTGRDGMLACVRDYLTAHQSHMLKAYDAGFLATPSWPRWRAARREPRRPTGVHCSSARLASNAIANRIFDS